EQAAARPGPPGPPPRPAAGQRPGTVRLPAGGTARLVRKEVGGDGVLPVPDGVGDATWWGAGLDAAAGATVLAGHVNWRGAVGPFAELWRVQRGQEVSVADAAGTTWRYRVTEVHTIDKDDLPGRAAALFGQEGEHRLVLVTCGGRWVGGDLGYDENRVVVAQPAS
ncbi:class F sortase, partial [Streptoalloteichus tenebrarius]|uniref:class F sortase n=1 Tax=Streptoalloteichus tenebrarius (strain ATCC 17920 / DSM 40477 / JCM 4838 / CBS 697.72 / NBRC 16177 / NCIMB 11028 / NRRL B-12390 / A12253. 1 / ISP 5477) TaxID=1933 RepID=UPI0035E79A39